MKIVTTPMCEEIVKLAGISDYVVNINPDEEEGDLAIVLSKSKVKMNAFRIKLNTPLQIFESIKEVSKLAGNELADEEIESFFKRYPISQKYLTGQPKKDVNVVVYSEFLKESVLDVGLNIVEENPDYVIFPDYLRSKVKENYNLVIIPSHDAAPSNPFIRIEFRYSILETLI